MDFKKNPHTRFEDPGRMSRQEAREEAEALREGIRYHDFRYYVENRPEISDALYDKLFRRLQDLEAAFPELRTGNSPTQRVGAAPKNELEKVAHASPMLSLNAGLGKEDFEHFQEFVVHNAGEGPVAYMLEPKFDGFSVEIVYEQGVFRTGATRGNGETGENISHNLRTIPSVPLHLQNNAGPPAFLSVRGEVFMKKKGFQDLNRERIEKGLEPFANPRNAAAGTMRQLDPKKAAGRPLDIFFYDILKIEGREFSSHREALGHMRGWGLKTNPLNKSVSSPAAVGQYHRAIAEKREQLEYEIDGIVIKVDDYALRERLGTRHRNPRWAMAWKFKPKKEVTVLEQIVVQVGRTGKLTPVALLQPVNVGGVTVSRATLHNAGEVNRKDVRPGDTVRVARAGDVIPEIVERIEQAGEQRSPHFSMPAKCPACGSEIYREGAYHFCQAGLTCPPQLVGRILHFASRDALDITGLGRKTVEALVEREMVGDIADIYRLSTDELTGLEGFAHKSAAQLRRTVQQRKHPRLDRFVYALGIRHVGSRTARLLANRYRRLERLSGARRSELEAIPEIGPEIAESVIRFFYEDRNRRVLERLEAVGVTVREMPAKEGDLPLKGKTFVFTGRLNGYTRKRAQELVEGLGANAAGSVSDNTDYVVRGENPGQKLQEARKKSVKIIEERDFRELVAQ